MTVDDALYRFRLRVFALAQEQDNVRAACRAMGIHPSAYYRWRRQLVRFGPEILMPRERRRPKMANQTPPVCGAAGPGLLPWPPRVRTGEDRSRTPPGQVGWDRDLAHGVHRVLRRHGLNTRAKRLGWWPATPLQRSPNEGNHSRSDTWRCPGPGRWSRWTASSSAGSRGQRAPCGSTSRSTWPLPTAEPSCISPRATRPPGGPQSSPAGWPLI